MKNKEYYQKTFSRLTASEDVIQEVMNMEQKKVYRFTKRTVGIAAAAALTLTATGAAYAATDGNFAQLLERITVYINGEEAVTPELHGEAAKLAQIHDFFRVVHQHTRLNHRFARRLALRVG